MRILTDGHWSRRQRILCIRGCCWVMRCLSARFCQRLCEKPALSLISRFFSVFYMDPGVSLWNRKQRQPALLNATLGLWPLLRAVCVHVWRIVFGERFVRLLRGCLCFMFARLCKAERRAEIHCGNCFTVSSLEVELFLGCSRLRRLCSNVQRSRSQSSRRLSPFSTRMEMAPSPPRSWEP